MGQISNSDKKDTTDNANATRSNITLRCGDCLHHKGTPHPSIGQPCNDRGVKTYAAAPNCYTANVQVFRKVAPETFGLLASILSHFSPQQSRVFMGLLKSAGSLEKHGFTFLERVYFRLGEDYLDTYYSGFVLGAGIQHNLMIVGSSFFTGIKHPVIAHLDAASVFNKKAFTKKQAQLTKAGKLYVPRKPQRNTITIDYTPPSIESSKEMLEAMAQKGGGKKKRPTNGVMEVDLKEYKSNYGAGKSSDGDE